MIYQIHFEDADAISLKEWAPLLSENVKHMSNALGCKHQYVSWVTLIQLDGLFARSRRNVWMSPYESELMAA